MWDGEAGDWQAYECENDDCPRRWHTNAYGINIFRKDGVRGIERFVVDEDGSASLDYYLETQQGAKGDEWPWISRDIARESDRHFRYWGLYWLDCAERGTDVLDQALTPHPNDWADFCIKAAKDNLKYLKMGK
ncbi:MAG: hypothetical protein HOK67_21255 [Deltaproteobacteria bacterium]|nr:hypothetical protein [Deltaproteobacteria bacterium]